MSVAKAKDLKMIARGVRQHISCMYSVSTDVPSLQPQALANI